jgi:hypothetical protein
MYSNKKERQKKPTHAHRRTYWRKLVSTGIVSKGKLMLHLDILNEICPETYNKW